MNTLFLNFFLNVHALILLSFGMSYLLHILTTKDHVSMSAASELRFNHILIFLVLALPIAATKLNDRFHFKPIAKTYLPVKYKEYDQLRKQQKSEEHIALTTEEKPKLLSIDTLKNIALLIILASIIYSVRQIVLDYLKLKRLLKKTFLFRKIGRVHIVFSENIRVPFSCKSFLRSWVVLPINFSEDPVQMKISILHEIQHHRQNDTQWIYFFQAMKALAGVNPALHQWFKIIFEIQEFKVDEALIDQGKVKRQEYARCLIEVAESVSQIEKPLVCATGLAFLPTRQELTRRIEFMYKKNKTSRIALALMATLILTSMTAVALTTSKAIDSRYISMSDAQKMANFARTNSQFPITLNQEVLNQLNRYLGTGEGRDFLKESLIRMKAYQPMIEAKLTEYNAPLELLAVGIAESGFQNLPGSANKFSGAAGIWQFVVPTARVFGLRVDKTVDERLHVEKETDAAIRYLLSNKLMFNNSWELALLAYNAGEKAVRAQIDKSNSYDAWTLLKDGLKTDQDYLAKIMAVILIMKNPNSLN